MNSRPTLHKFLKYWVKGDLKGMYRNCQITWAELHTWQELELFTSPDAFDITWFKQHEGGVKADALVELVWNEGREILLGIGTTALEDFNKSELTKQDILLLSAKYGDKFFNKGSRIPFTGYETFVQENRLYLRLKSDFKVQSAIRLVREGAAYKARESGKWGVNPISMMRMKQL